MKKKRSRQDEILTFTPTKQFKKDKDIIIPIKLIKSAGNRKKDKNSKTKKKLNLKQLPSIKISIEPFEKIKINLNTVEELHNLAINKFNELKKDKNTDYNIILKEVIKIYDLDEDINKFFLNKLREYYLENKDRIDREKTGESNTIASLFFNYIFTLNYDTRGKIAKTYNYFGKNEIFLEKDKQYYDLCFIPLDKVFKNFIRKLFEISSTIKCEKNIKSQEEYEKDLQGLYSNYQFPESSYKIPIKFGNKDLMYLNFIIEFQALFCLDQDTLYKKKFYSYKITSKFLALNFFEEYFLKEDYDLLSIQYILFCLYSFFLYYQYDINIDNVINERILICSRFLFQSIKEKRSYLKKLKHYIKKDINYDKIDEDYLSNNLLTIQYKNKTININGNNFYFLDGDEYMDDLINENAYSFEYLKTIKFPLFMNKELNDDYNSFVKDILKSKVTLEYINSFKNIPFSYESIFTDKIIEEIKSNTFWVKFPIENLHGITNRNTYTIFLNKNITEDNKYKKSNILASKVITSAHEDCNHIIRLILAINDYKISKTTPKNMELYNNEKFNEISKKWGDQGDMWENILFGEKINRIFIMGSLVILDIKNYQSNINDLKDNFQNYNKKFPIEDINKRIKLIKNNTKNKLIKYIMKFNVKDLVNNFWLENEQYISARNNLNVNFNNNQCISFGCCGTHGFDFRLK